MQSNKLKSKKVLVVLAASSILICLLIAFDLSPLGGNIRFYKKWSECGQKPVGVNLEWNFGGGTLPNYGTPPSFELLRFRKQTYFCTELDAEKAGYSADPKQYEFPAIKKYNAEHPDNKIEPNTSGI